VRKWRDKVRSELETAEAARKLGNEGMARVCARRAAGWAASAFLEGRGIEVSAKSSFQHMLILKDSDLIGAEVRGRLEKLTSSLKNDDPQGVSYLPANVDLIEEARKLAESLLSDHSV